MAHPQPVTTTVTKPDWMKLQYVRERNNSLDSIGSTASLLSILDHGSYDSEDDQLSEKNFHNRRENTVCFSHELLKPRNQREKQMFSELLKEKEESRNSFIEDISKDFHDICISNVDEERSSFVPSGSQSVCPSSSNEKLPRPLTPWEKWLLMKIKEERDISIKQEEQKKMKKIAKIREAQALEEKKIEINHSWYKWLEEKAKAEKLRICQERREYIENKKQEAVRKQEIAEKSEVNFKQWLNKKKMLEKTKKKIEAQKKKEKQSLHKLRQEKAKETYKEWCERINKSGINVSQNRLDNKTKKLRGYTNKNACPPSTFFNPVPWKPLVIPVKTNGNENENNYKKERKYSKEILFL
ncbi:coiled-coil domain-containing protein 34 isoform X1 [Octopus bimaculoides]|nr:coiled-coil domain-containing protein 34 isoform X1 [Octopus bimaculoides]XP_014772852.1 coiled-coil domain-containing protein 34 isoform X1 [Octopus bimaculoides]XP_052824876.1 coiled-coil domain-containing protein 34 isoform X1 [Octopus bimaculoides]XP_052824884.1 coiled-coil domain-containing protein 34 isoform X1 [Octopus bimaculoides]XP_052824888.1 coiled-coil domain-containing protein 34 isoform X1 [Octopus bimaculoides]XP_052824890.1 coiled-coil domain-containing protein 34 isoform X|eukprot:XP_014772849.1 PREDICTED: coiled-coil domain-containing protein 34-like isoform X1 [Octopus bimaculoides]